MSAKAKKAAPAPKSKPAAKAENAVPKKSAKQTKQEALEAEATALLAKAAGGEDEAEEEEEKAASTSSGGGNAAALAAVTGTSEMSASFKNFRHHPDMENFYRFIYENDLRLEALAIINDMMVERANRKLVMKAKSNAH